jgi:TRAP-type C4-dicarboxylate transport system permease small subunit
MQPRIFFSKIETGIHALVKALSRVAIVALSAMILFVVSNILARFFFKSPIPGTIELVELIAVIVVFLAVGYTEFRRAHISIELVVNRFSSRARAVTASIMYLLSAAFFVILGWRGAVLAWSYSYPTIRDSYVLSIPFAPFIFFIAFGSAVLGLEALTHVFRPLPVEDGKGEAT